MAGTLQRLFFSKRVSLPAVLVLITGIGFSGVSQATNISYEVSNIAGNTWEYAYTVDNDTLAVDIEEFTIYFAVGDYENLSIGLTPASWDPLLNQPDSFLPDDGIYDVLALATGIAPGDSLGGFSVTFDYLGAGTPGDQDFEIVDPFSFNAIDFGTTVPLNTGSVPEPTSLALLATGALLLRIRRSSKRTLFP